MAYIDSAYYMNVWGGVPTDDFTVLAERASDMIDMLTRFTARDFDSLTDLQKELVQKATCSQVDFFGEFGLNSTQDGGESWTVGKVSVGGSNGSTSEYKAKGVSALAVSYLEQSGLLYRGIRVL